MSKKKQRKRKSEGKPPTCDLNDSMTMSAKKVHNDGDTKPGELTKYTIREPKLPARF